MKLVMFASSAGIETTEEQECIYSYKINTSGYLNRVLCI